MEIWFSIPAGKALSGASFNSVAGLEAHIDAFIDSYSETAQPFAWRNRRSTVLSPVSRINDSRY